MEIDVAHTFEKAGLAENQCGTQLMGANEFRPLVSIYDGELLDDDMRGRRLGVWAEDFYMHRTARWMWICGERSKPQGRTSLWV